MRRIPLEALTHPNPLVRLAFAWGVGALLWIVAWAVSYPWLPEGAVSVAAAAMIPLQLDVGGAGLAAQLFGWNLVFGGGAVVLASLFAIGRISVGYLAPWWWFVTYGAALGTNSFVLTVPGARLAPRLDVLWQHVGVAEISAYLLLAVALANLQMWRQVHWRNLRLARVRRWSDLRLSGAEAACLIGAVSMLAAAAWIEAHQIAAAVQVSVVTP